MMHVFNYPLTTMLEWLPRIYPHRTNKRDEHNGRCNDNNGYLQAVLVIVSVESY